MLSLLSLIACGASWQTIDPRTLGDSGVLDSADSGPVDTDTDTDTSVIDTSVTPTDDDGDGVSVEDGDCDDADPDVHPGATEVCDSSQVDEDCNGLADDADVDATGKVVTFHDGDGDGYGVGDGVAWCAPPDGERAPNAGDCNDASAAVYPAAADATGGDGIDNDCDGFVDEDSLADGDVLITEMFWRGDDDIDYTVAVPRGAYQWVELYNNAGTTLNLEGWSLDLCYVPGTTLAAAPTASACVAGATTTVTFAAGTTLAAGARLVVCADSTAMPDCDVDFDFADGMAGMSIWNGWVSLRARGATLGPAASTATSDLALDSVAYVYKSASDYWPSGPKHSMRLEDSVAVGATNSLGNDTYGTTGPSFTTWCYAENSTTWTLNGAVRYGTPGTANGTCI